MDVPVNWSVEAPVMRPLPPTEFPLMIKVLLPSASSVPELVTPPPKFNVPLCTSTVPVLLNSVEIVEVAAEPDLRNVPWLFTAALAPVSLLPWLLAWINNPVVVVVSSLNVAPLRIVSVPEPGSLPPVFGLVAFRSITAVPPFDALIAALVPPSCSVRPPSSPKLTGPALPLPKLTPPCTSVVPDPLSVPEVIKLPVPVTVSVPEPFSSPPDCVSEPVLTVPLNVAVPPVTLNEPVPVPPFTVVVPPLNVALPWMFDVASSVCVPPAKFTVPWPL